MLEISYEPMEVSALKLKFNCPSCGSKVESMDLEMPAPDYTSDSVSDGGDSEITTVTCESCDEDYDVTVYANAMGGYVQIEELDEDDQVELIETALEGDPFE